MICSSALVLLWISAVVSLPATKLDLVPAELSETSNVTYLEAGSTLTDRVGLALPVKINKDELVSWVTHAMRIMASKINITLAAATPEQMPSERMEMLLRNGSATLNNFIERMSSRGNATGPRDRITKTSMSSGFKQNNPLHDLRMKHDCKKAGILGLTTERSMRKPNKLIPKQMKEVMLVKTDDDSGEKIFRDPNVFPPFNTKHSITLPLDESDKANEKLKNYYSTRNMSSKMGQNMFNAEHDPMNSIQFVPLGPENSFSIGTADQTKLQVHNLRVGPSSSISNQPVINIAGTTLKPVLSVPFEAFITFTQDTTTARTTTSTQATSRRTTKKKNKNKIPDNRYEASTSGSKVVKLLNGRDKSSKKNKTPGKTTVLFDLGDKTATATMGPAEKKKKKTEILNQLPYPVQLVFRMLTMLNKNSSMPTVTNDISKTTKIITTKLIKILRGNKNDTKIRKQLDGDDDGDGDNDGNGDDDGDNGDGNDNNNGNDNAFDNDNNIETVVSNDNENDNNEIDDDNNIETVDGIDNESDNNDKNSDENDSGGNENDSNNGDNDDSNDNNSDDKENSNDIKTDENDDNNVKENETDSKENDDDSNINENDDDNEVNSNSNTTDDSVDDTDNETGNNANNDENKDDDDKVNNNSNITDDSVDDTDNETENNANNDENKDDDDKDNNNSNTTDDSVDDTDIETENNANNDENKDDDDKDNNNSNTTDDSVDDTDNETENNANNDENTDDDDKDIDKDNNDDDDNGNGNGFGGGIKDNRGDRDVVGDDDDGDGGTGDDDDYNDDPGSLGSLEDFLPVVISILEDLSDPDSDTDLTEFLIAAIPLLQGLSEPDPETGEAPDFIGVLQPILTNLVLGKDGQGSDFGAILGPIIQLVGPFIGPLLGPILGPLISQLSGEQGSSIGALLAALLEPLSQAPAKGQLSPIASVTAEVTSILLQQLSKPGSEVDIGKLVSQVVTGALSGTSAGLSGGSKGHPKPEYGPPPAYGPPAQIEFIQPPPLQQPTRRTSKRPTTRSPNRFAFFRPQATQYRPQATHPESVQDEPIHFEQVAAPAQYGGYGTYGVPAHTVNPFELIKNALKDILSSSVNLVTSFLSASTATSGASSQSSSTSSQPSYGYGPQNTYGPPQQSYGGASYQKPYNKVDSYQNIK